MHQVQQLLRKFYGAIGTPQALRLRDLASRGEWARLQAETTSHPSLYDSWQSYMCDAVTTSIARKLAVPGDAEKRKKKAVETFWAAEAQCRRTNDRLRNLRLMRTGDRLITDTLQLRLLDFVQHWRDELRKCLGSPPAWLEPEFSSGSTLSNTGNLTTIPDKIRTEKPTFYPGLFPYEWLLDATPMLRGRLTPVRANRFFTVPKDAEKDRGCCIEASLSVSYQLAIGKVLKSRYRRRYKVDLAEAQDLHRTLAMRGSRDGTWATIDLSNASDTVSKELIRLLFPADWLMILESLRAPCTSIEGKTVFLEKFSSMGNGFTFELETLLFRSLAAALGITRAYTYGDDIIVPSGDFLTMCRALTVFGFTPNMKKTFGEGPFRESCGGDFFWGVGVRPFFLKEIPDDPTKWIAVANGLRRIDPDLTFTRAAWRFAIDQIPKNLRIYGPEDLGDGVLYDPDARPTNRRFREYSRARGRGGEKILLSEYEYPAFQVVVKKQRTFALGEYWDYTTAIAAACLGQDSRVTPRNSEVTGWKVVWVPYHGSAEVPS